jgi:hypothetical protein
MRETEKKDGRAGDGLEGFYCNTNVTCVKSWGLTMVTNIFGICVYSKEDTFLILLVLAEEKLHNIWAQLEHLPCKPFKCIAQGMVVSEWTKRIATELLELQPFRITVLHFFQPCVIVNRQFL